MTCNLILNLSNSVWYLDHKNTEVLEDFHWINENIIDSGDLLTSALGPDTLTRLKALRNVVVRVFEGDKVDAHMDFLNDCLSRSLFFNKITLNEGHPSIEKVSTTSKEDRMISAIIIELIEAIETGLISRIHTCDLSDCQFYFLDQSKNQNKKYCSIKCNNVAKVRRFRDKGKV